MGFEMIKTKSKKEFLQEERDWFPSMTNDEYKEEMTEDAISCKNCGVWYWVECKKRCNC